MPKIPDIILKIKYWFFTVIATIRGFLGKKRLVFIITGAGLLVFLVYIGTFLLIKPGIQEKPPAEKNQRLVPVSPDEIFLPEEPDFVPPVILEREPRTAWTLDDAIPFWQDPLKEGEGPWRERIKIMIDEFLENVP